MNDKTIKEIFDQTQRGTRFCLPASDMMTPEGIKNMERGFELKRRAVELLKIIAMEFKSDPQSVQCFDLRIVEEVKSVTSELEDIGEF